MTRQIYSDGKQYSNTQELENVIVPSWLSLDENVIYNLVSSMPNRVFDVVRSFCCLLAYG